MKQIKDKTSAQKTSSPILDYYNLSPWGKVFFVSKAILKIIYQKLRHPIQTYKLRKIEIEKHKDEPSTKSKLATLLFCIFTGFLGGHRFYVRRYLTAILFFCTIGFCFIGVIFDLVTILKNRFKDGHGRQILKWRVKGDVLALLIALLSLVIMSLQLPTALATITFYGCTAGAYFEFIDSDSCNKRRIYDAFLSKSSGELTDTLAPIVRKDKETEK